jgi:hypothetical protein
LRRNTQVLAALTRIEHSWSGLEARLMLPILTLITPSH